MFCEKAGPLDRTNAVSEPSVLLSYLTEHRGASILIIHYCIESLYSSPNIPRTSGNTVAFCPGGSINHSSGQSPYFIEEVQ
jgi:hypothetical protein